MSISRNPFSGEILRRFPTISGDALREKIEGAYDAFLQWRECSIEDRTRLLGQVGELLIEQKESLAETITQEIGKPIAQSRSEIEKCAWACKFYAMQAEGFLVPREVPTEASRSYVCYDPLGPVLAVMPWNYPFWQVFRFAAPALAAGNVCLLKHAPNVWICAARMEALFEEAGFPQGVFQTLFIDTSEIEAVIASPKVRAVTLTGSTGAGSAVGSLCGKYLKKSVMELGGNNAVLVFPDADMGEALKTCVEARFQNTGQSCIAGKRLLLHEAIARDFLPALVEQVGQLICGDPADPQTYIGVMAREDLAKTLEDQMRISLEMGAVLECGGQRKGVFFQPTILSKVTCEMPVFREETFGPLLAVCTFSSEQEGLKLAQDSRYGLGVSVFTEDQPRIERLVRSFDEGAIFINSLVKSDPRLPFGGVRDSGLGRELSIEGIREFVNIKTVYIK